MRLPRFSAAMAGLVIRVVLAASTAGAQELPNLPPITTEDLALRDNPAAPGAAAMILYYAVDTDNTKSTETYAVRIKVFRDEGKKYADVEIPYNQKETRVEEIRARTVGPDGHAAEFTDQIYDREIVKAKGYRVNAKVLTLPNVQAGSILEYSYRLHYKGSVPDVFRNPGGYLITRGITYPAAEWVVQRDLFLRHGHFTLRPAAKAEIREFHVAMPEDAAVRRMSDAKLQLDVDNIPAYEQEEYSPPEENLRIRVDLYYALGFFAPAGFWEGYAVGMAEKYESFLKKSKAIEREAARLALPGDSPEAKLRKIYARVQQIRAVSFEADKTEKQKKQENLKENKDVEDVLTRGYAFGNEINLLFVALARAAGFDADPVLVGSRKRAFFNREFPNEDQLNSMLVIVHAGKSLLYLDPATRFCPFGLLPWEETDAGGIVVDRLRPDVGSTPGSKSADAVTRLEAKLRLNEEGELSGKVKVLYFGQEALSVRLNAIREDEVERRKELEEVMKNELAPGAGVKLLGVEDWEGSEGPLKAEFEIEVPNFATPAGRRLVLPLAVFHAQQKNPFPSTQRVHPIYFSYAQENYEEVKLELPPGMQVESLAPDQKADQRAAYYEFSTKKEGNTLRMTRAFQLAGYYFKQQQYPVLRGFYEHVLAGDAQQATLRRAENAQAK